MTTHCIISTGSPKLPVISGNAMLTAVSSGTTDVPRPTRTSRNTWRGGIGVRGAPFGTVRCIIPKMSQAERSAGTGFALAVHGGAGTIPRDEASRSRAASYHDGLRRALAAGYDILAAAGNALDAVTAAVAMLEDNPLFNAGRGSVFTRAGTQEMDACVMDGTEHRAGAVAGVFGLCNPV